MNEPNMKFLDFRNNQSYSIPNNKISLSIDDKSTRRITLNEQLTKLVRDDEYCYLRVGFNEFSSDMYFIFCKESTPDALILGATKGKARVIINSKYLVEQMIDRMGLNRSNQLLSVSENLAKSSDYYTFRISK